MHKTDAKNTNKQTKLVNTCQASTLCDKGVTQNIYDEVYERTQQEYLRMLMF